MLLNRFLIRPLWANRACVKKMSAGDTTGGFLTQQDDPVLTGPKTTLKLMASPVGCCWQMKPSKMVEPEAQIEHGVNDGDIVEPGSIFLKITARASTFFCYRTCRHRLDSTTLRARYQG
ncbi:MAG: hypothetical protein CM1200mP41_07010 [Gammaproteobacteria bacterium]|nr:MAG: hypothetical protein CM1200mP41_07010 [Gammaproteobacteria bacterium]